MHTYLMEMLVCPVCHGELTWRITEQKDAHIETAEARCNACAATYPVRDGIGLFLSPALPRNDLWQQVDSGLLRHLHEHPELQRQLMTMPPATLSPADRFFRALVLESRGDFGAAQIAEDLALKGLYTPAYLRCWQNQLDYVIEHLSTTRGPIVDLASGRGYLVERIIRRLQRPVVATDFSPGVLRRNRQWLQHLGLYEQVSLLAFDARLTPFKDGAVDTLTTNLGLPNIEEPGNLLKELRRIVGGMFLSVSHFYPEDDKANAKVIRKAGLASLLYRRSALEQFATAGWAVEVKNLCEGQASPTPPSIILDGATIDGLPVADTHLAWCVLLGHRAKQTKRCG